MGKLGKPREPTIHPGHTHVTNKVWMRTDLQTASKHICRAHHSGPHIASQRGAAPQGRPARRTVRKDEVTNVHSGASLGGIILKDGLLVGSMKRP